MSKPFLIDQSAYPVSSFGGLWHTDAFYLMETPYGFCTIYHSVDRTVIKIITHGKRHTKIMANVQSKKHAVTLAKRFIDEVLCGYRA